MSDQTNRINYKKNHYQITLKPKYKIYHHDCVD